MIKIPSVLYIKKRSLPEWLALFIFVMPFLLSFLEDFLHFPGFVRYFVDVAWVLAIVLLLLRKQVPMNRNLIPLVVLICTFFAYTLFAYAFHYQSVLYYLWGFRNKFRFYFAFFIYCMVFSKDDIDKFLKFIDALFWVNALVTLFQFFVMGYQQDHLGGIFGVDRGCNASSIVLFSIVISKSILRFMSNEEGFWPCFSKVAVALFISAMAELKFFFIVFVLILLMATFMTSFAWRKIVILFFSAVIISFAGTVITGIFGDGSALTFDKLFELATSENYSSNIDLGRLTGIPTISRTIFGDLSDRLFGLGLGNCDTSSFDIFNTPFYQVYGDLHYSWFSAVFIFLETGGVGLLFYVLFFAFCFTFALIQKKRGANPLYCQIAMIMAILNLVIMFYNASLTTEVGYVVYFILAMPFIAAVRKDTDTPASLQNI